jgi:hypothetical protein
MSLSAPRPSVATTEEPARVRDIRFRSRGTARARFALAAIVALSLAVALFWVVRMPLFESPDENAHADYAFTLFATQNFVPTAGRIPATDVDPLVRYLGDAVAFRTMRLNPDGRVPAGYGSRAFYRALDADAPRVPRDFLADDGRRVPYVATTYSFLYYALDAMAIAAGGVLSGGSATIEAFAARAFGLVLLACSLLLSYGILRELRVRVRVALGIVATIGLFPLTSWVSAYVQPDNLSFTAVSLALYSALRLRREPDQLRAAAWTGAVLAVLALTKSQYFVAVALPVLTDRVLRFAARPHPWSRWCAFAVLIGAPLLLADLVLRATIAGTGSQVAYLVSANGNPLAAPAHAGLPALAVYIAQTLVKAWTSFFYNGFTFYGYWGEFSWNRTQIVFGPPLVTASIYALLGACSVLVGLLVAVRLAFGVWPRLLRVARARGVPSALRLLASDVPLNAYLLFIGIMLVVYVGTDGGLAGEGRYWLPFILPAILCAVRYAPKALPSRRLQNVFATTFGAGLLAYSALGVFAAPAAMEARFYAPAPSRPNEGETWALVQRLGAQRITAFETHDEPTFAPGSRVAVEGVAIDSRSGLVPRSVEILVDGRPRVRASLGTPKPRIVAAMHDDLLLGSGFTATLDLRGLAPGPHELQLAIGERDRAAPHLSRAHVRFVVGRQD